MSSSAHAASAKSTGGTSVKTTIKTTPVVHVPTPPVNHVKVTTPPVVHHVPTPPVNHVKVRPPPKPPPPPPKKPAYKYGDPIPTDAPPPGQALFPAGLTAPYALSLGPRTAFWGPAPGKPSGAISISGLITPFKMQCPCYINMMHGWLDQHAGRDAYAIHGADHLAWPGQAVHVYLIELRLAAAFVDRFACRLASVAGASQPVGLENVDHQP